MVEGPLSFSVFIGQERTVTGMVMGLLKDPDADDDLSASDTLTAIALQRRLGGSLRHADRQHARHVAHSPGYKLDWVP